jgi:hypothetical protein
MNYLMSRFGIACGLALVAWLIGRAAKYILAGT